MFGRLRRDESGQILPVAVAFVAMFALTAVATLAWVTASMGLVSGIRGRADRLYTADGGVDYAIEQLRRNQELGVDGSLTCYSSPTSSGSFGLPAMNGFSSTSGTVSYQARPNSGTCLPGAGTPQNTPPYAIFTRSTTNALDFTGNNDPAQPSLFTARGDVYAAGPLELNASSALQTSAADASHPGNVRTHNGGPCPAGVTVTYPTAITDCNLGSTFDAVPSFRLPDATLAGEDDPGTMGLADPAGEARSGSLTVFSPGRYVDPPQTTGARLYVFEPGIYYFDFLADGAGSDTWTVDAANSAIVGGVLSNTDWTEPNVPVFPGACDTAQSGVEFVFGHTSRMVVGAVRGFELCPFIPAADDQHVAIYGVHDLFGFNLNPQGDLVSPGTDKYSPTLDTNVSGTWRTPKKAYTPGRKEATVDATSGTVTHEWTGYRESEIPAGAAITKLRVYPTHREAGDSGYTLTAQASVTSGGTTQSSSAVNVPANLSSDFTQHTVDLTLSSPLSFTNVSDPRQIKVRFSMEKTSTAKTSLFLDWIPVTIFYTVDGTTQEFVPRQDNDSPANDSSVSGSWQTPERAYAIDGGEARVNNNSAGTTVTHQWSGFASEVVVPAGAQITAVTAYPRHRESGDAGYQLRAQAFVTGGDGATVSSPDVVVASNLSDTLVQEGVTPGRAAVALPLASTVPWLDDATSSTQIRLRFSLAKIGGGNTTLRLDWMPITVTYQLPWRAASGCVLADTCALFDASDPAVNAYLQGTYYAPQGRTVARSPATGQAVYARGVIAQSARFLMNAARTTAAIAQVPLSVGLNVSDREVLVTVTVGSSTVTSLVSFSAFTQVPTVRVWNID